MIYYIWWLYHYCVICIIYTILHYIILHYIILHYVILYHILFYSVILYYITLHYIILYHVTSYYIILYHIISHYIISYHIILHYIILYYIILYYIILYLHLGCLDFHSYPFGPIFFCSRITGASWGAGRPQEASPALVGTSETLRIRGCLVAVFSGPQDGIPRKIVQWFKISISLSECLNDHEWLYGHNFPSFSQLKFCHGSKKITVQP